MGSFNVTCSISNLSITPGTKCVFIPLIRNSFHFPDPERMGSMVGPGHCAGPAYFFYPFSLPIFGEYDDYGRIGKIERTKTVEVLEKFFDISIDQFVEILTSGRDSEDTYSGMYGVLGINKEANSKHYNFSSHYLLDLGFTKITVNDKVAYRFKDHESHVRVVLKEYSTSSGKMKRPIYKIYSKGKLRKSGGFSSSLDFLRDYRKITGYAVCYPEDQQAKVKLLEKLSSMFVHGEVYQALSEIDMGEYGKPDVWETAAEVDEHTLKSLGFLYTGEDKSIERWNKIYKHPAVDTYFVGTDSRWSIIYSAKNKKQLDNNCFHPDAFIKTWFKLTGHQLELPAQLKGTSIYFSKFDVYRDSLVELEKLMKVAAELDPSMGHDLWIVKDLLMDSKLCFGFVPQYERGEGLIKLYDEVIKDGSIKNEFISFASFFSNLQELNKLLFPASYAGQVGNNWGQKFLAQKVIEIVIEEEKECAKWEDDSEDDE